jgi:hypothetical protein
MAGITISAANVDKFVPRVLHEGVFSQTFRIDYNGVSISISDVVVIGYIAQGVQVLSGFAWGGGSSAGDTFKFGVGAVDNNLSTAIAVGATTVPLAGFVPKSFSLSSDAEGNLKLQVIATKVTGTMTATGSLNLTLMMQALPIS